MLALEDQEQDMLDLATETDATSRLVCQIRVTESLCGARIQVSGKAQHLQANNLSTISPDAAERRRLARREEFLQKWLIHDMARHGFILCDGIPRS